MKLFLDDTRNVPEGYILVRTYKEMIKLLESTKPEDIEEISLDHDLGSKESGYDICKWIVANNYWPKTISLHSANIVGVGNMIQLLNHYKPSTTILNRKIFY